LWNLVVDKLLIFSDSQTALKALSGPKVTSRLVAECLDAVSVLANRNEITPIWVPGHCGIAGSEKADELDRQGAAMTLLGPQPALGIPRCSAGVATKN
jgi:ribonuclease HI